MKPYYYLYLASAALLLLGMFSCASTPGIMPMDIESFSLIDSITLEKSADKVLYNPQSSIIYALNAKTQEIYIYKNGVRQNVLGGLGTGNAGFQLVSDIALGADGGLLALDTAAKSVRKYSADGKSLGAMELAGSVQPQLIALHSEQSLFVYDAATAEIIAYSAMDGTEQYRFGRFQVQQLSSLVCNRDFLVAYSKDTDTSQVFSVLGQFVKSDPGQSVYDVYNNGISYSGELLKSVSSPAFLPVSDKQVQMSIAGDVLVLGLGEAVRLLKINYLQVR